jgi:futalosine hydrolase
MHSMDKTPGEILIAVAHPSEEEAVRKAVSSVRCSCELIVTGVGGAAMSWALQKRFSAGALPRMVIGAGIAGSYIPSVAPGDAVITRSDCFADMGVDDNGNFRTLFASNLADPDRPPFSGGRIHCSGELFEKLSVRFRAVKGATVNMSSGSQAVIDRIRKAWDPDIETMEGAWLAYACALSHVPWVSLRAVSNMVEPRDLSRWDIPLALRSLKEAMIQVTDIVRAV